jgi:hypothetical protein
MDLSTGPGLAAAVASFLNREDLGPQVPAFVRLAEARFNRELRVREQVRRVYTETGGEEIFTLPVDFVEAKSLRITAPHHLAGQLDYAAPDMAADLDAGRGSDPMHGCRPERRTRSYGIVGQTLDLSPRPTVPVTVELIYYRAVPPLDVATPGASTWLLTKAPDLYLYASLMASAPFLVEDERLATWAGLASDALASLNTEAERVKTAGSRLNARRRTFG